ncbi:hypothetical protein BAUCODRAFT_152676 [Baudoinia panamericana UAMH 10762]|uniref:DH domain-containing protein n=1 Tax=Baudoinia panamericana (strain UAMH 10762) TaxID=717646 RepID=M2MXM5_BAUPA|nr:uncharacterized protein BAUCODRAFT_152676 [Baudoinia panamericana UAMH 10762]EMC91419.1 hypothetical protein BAUCODRAFT_152676 [Baudoinia panamericana UAMH 10762]
MAVRQDESPLRMSASVDGPHDPKSFHGYSGPTPPSPSNTNNAQLQNGRVDAEVGVLASQAQRSYSRSPVRNQLRSASNPPDGGNHSVNGIRSNPVLLPTRQSGSVKDIAHKFDRGAAGPDGAPALRVETTQERYRRAQAAKTASQRSPESARLDLSMTKLQKRRPAQARSPQRSPPTSFETSSSFSSNATVTSSRSQPVTATSPRASRSPVKQGPYPSARPLFGELTVDGWHGNFDLPGYGQAHLSQSAQRRQSDGSIALGHGRSQSHQDMGWARAASPVKQSLNHKRSRSEMEPSMKSMKPQPAPSMPNLNAQNVPSLYPTPPNSGSRNVLRKESPAFRNTAHRRHPSEESSGAAGSQTRARSSGPEPRRLSKSPTRPRQIPNGGSNQSNTTPRNRYQPPPMSTSSPHQTLSAKIFAPQPKVSPPLRSSRPRQPVSAATTSASRARAADRFQKDVPKDMRRPSEQWLGKPYDAQKERTKRKIPELGKVDFEERRARIQKAISQNLEREKSRESLRSQSRQASGEASSPTSTGAEGGARNEVDATQANVLDEETMRMESAGKQSVRARGLSVDTKGRPELPYQDSEPKTTESMATEFEVDESPVLGKEAERQFAEEEQAEPEPAYEEPILLSAVAYRPPPAKARTPEPIQTQNVEYEIPEVQSPSVLESAQRMRQLSESSMSHSGTEFAEDSPSGETSPSDMEDRWGLGHRTAGDQGSIRIMLDEDAAIASQPGPWPKHAEQGSPAQHNEFSQPAAQTQRYSEEAYISNGYTESPVDGEDGYPDDSLQETPRKHHSRDSTLTPGKTQPLVTYVANVDQTSSDGALAQAMDQYQKTGQVSPEILAYIQDRSVDLQRISANGGSDGLMVQNLLDSILDLTPARDVPPVMQPEILQPTQYEMPLVTPDTPPDAAIATGTAVVFRNVHAAQDEDEDFEEKIRKADEAWERQQRGEDAMLGASDEDRPTPPPKDVGYTPRSSSVPNSATFPPNMAEGLRISTVGDHAQDGLAPSREIRGGTPVNERLTSPRFAPPLPSHAPPAPPPPPQTNTSSPLATRLPFGMPDAQQMSSSYSERGSNELSPRTRKNLWGPSGSSRPSMDSQRGLGPPSLPGTQSMSSFTESMRHNSMDTAADSQTRLVKTGSPGPEQKRLMKRRHIIKELLDTENTYHQDLKIIEDIYRATAGDLVTAEDKKTLFGNCDDIERFSLHFYDELRKAVAPVYVPPKQMRWANKRGSFSTTQSDGTGQTSVQSSDSVDEEKDRATTIGRCFLANLQRMDHVYGAYLKNHDAANQRLSALKNTSTVKCWLDECHNNASDITSAWDLDSLLVKPTQRVSKYPMLLTQLLETTPSGHPDYDALKSAAKDVIGMLTRINDAKKRADIVDQIINRKGKETDMRSGIAKAFGRRTEKLKERVGIAEAFQDAEFDELSHRFGGHFIRLQICMRDVQDYMHRIDRSMEQINNLAAGLEMFTDVSQSSLPEIESKWRKYSLAIREITAIAFPEHKAAVHKRVIQPMVTCIRLHDGPQNAINKRKKRIVDYAKCKSIEKRGDKPDKKTLEASEMYEALNDQLKIELPKLYSLTAKLVQGCLNCFVDVQLQWHNMWERKLRPILEAADIPEAIGQIEPAFRPDYELVRDRLLELAICNGATLADSANFLSPVSTLRGDSADQPTLSRPPTLDIGKRTLSVGSEASPIPPGMKRYSSGYGLSSDGVPPGPEGRIRSNSALSARNAHAQTPASITNSRPWSSANTPTSSFSGSRPSTANQQAPSYQPVRQSGDDARSPRPASGQTYFTARPEPTVDQRFSGLFSSALPPDLLGISDPAILTPKAQIPPQTPTFDGTDAAETEKAPVMFVCASLFEFSIDKTRKEAGYPYLTYAQGEVFDVIAQKGELWLAKNQDDSKGMLGWIWEQHFVILSHET